MKSPKKTTSATPKTLDEADPFVSLNAKLKTADSEIQHYVAALEAENLKCAKKVAKLQAENVTLKNRITILEAELRAEKEKTKTIDLIEQIKHESSEE